MRPGFILSGILVVVLYLAGQYMSWQEQKYDYVYNYMYEYTSPKLRALLACGHDALLADLALIRGIQFYGMNYPLFDKHPVQYEQFVSLGNTMEQLDPRHTEGYKFWGFALTSAKRGKVDSYRFLMRGAENQTATDEYFHAILPTVWKLAKEAGYVAHYELHSETPEWGCKAYRLALRSEDCPEFINRLVYFACKEIEPDPMPHLMELAHQAVSVKNPALRALNIEHIRRIVAEQHKAYWDGAQAYYREINGATPTRLSELMTVPILKEAAFRYREMSRKWFPGGTATRLFPNLMNVNLQPEEPPEIVEAVEPQQPIDPFGGKYVILPIKDYKNDQLVTEHRLMGTGVVETEREALLDTVRGDLEAYKKDHNGQCPPDAAAFTADRGIEPPKADSLGYEVVYDATACEFRFPPISEDNPPTTTPYGRTLEQMKEMEFKEKNTY
ncbi:MAG: hypothetical protein HUU16_15280 [Candidatus Omnitrophica bacterium]|nr:hypothetical protein [bacterium]NUN97524.1 hypothetical protein [Candidatus Omnitrophota bacterium]